MDVFDVITLKNGEQKVLVQDLDAFFLADDHQANWEQSTEALIKVNSYRIHGNAPIAKQIVLEVAKEMGFSQR